MNRVALVIVLFLIIICIICTYNYDFSTQQGNEIYKLIFEGSISGIVTLGGLLFTFFRQEEISRCPCLVFEQSGICKAREVYSDVEKRDCIDCCTSKTEYVRKVTIKIHNIKNTWAINTTIGGLQQGSIKGLGMIERTVILPSKDNGKASGEIKATFQDSFGKEYRQVIAYMQNGTSYTFVSNQPSEGV